MRCNAKQILLILVLFASCTKEQNLTTFSVKGTVKNNFGFGLEGVKIYFNNSDFVTSDTHGNWSIEGLQRPVEISAIHANYEFSPTSILISGPQQNIMFKGTKINSTLEDATYQWITNQQLTNGLVRSSENNNLVSLYDNALAALVFIMKEDFEKAEKIFDFFNTRMQSELQNGVGGFSQFRDEYGIPNNHRWMGDNVWLLIALNNYKFFSGSSRYDALSNAIQSWLIGLQDADGGLFAGYDSNNNLLNFKVTEGNIDAFNALQGYSESHSKILNFLHSTRWNITQKALMAWPDNPQYSYALDVFSWSYLVFEDFPSETLTNASRFLTTKIDSKGRQVIGYCFDEDKDVVWLEGTAQMSLAFAISRNVYQNEFYETQLENAFLENSNCSSCKGLPYATNQGTHYGADALWNGADTQISLSSSVWYLFSTHRFSPFQVEYQKNIPEAEKFWKN